MANSPLNALTSSRARAGIRYTRVRRLSRPAPPHSANGGLTARTPTTRTQLRHWSWVQLPEQQTFTDTPVHKTVYMVDSSPRSAGQQLPEYTLIGSTAGPGAVLTSTTGNGEPLLCDLWPYWYSSASYGVGASCKETNISPRPASHPVPIRRHGSARIRPAPGFRRPRGGTTTSGFTVEARYLFTFNGPFQLQFSGSNEIFVFINGVLVVDLGALHNVIPGRVSIDASGTRTSKRAGTSICPARIPAGKTTCPVIPAGYSVGDMVPCDGGANAVESRDGSGIHSTCPSGNSTCDCRSGR